MLFFLINGCRSMKLNLEQYKAFLDELAKNKKVELADVKKKMANCGPPGFTGGTGSGVRVIYYILLLVSAKIHVIILPVAHRASPCSFDQSVSRTVALVSYRTIFR